MTRFKRDIDVGSSCALFCSRGRDCSCPKVVDNAMILCSSCERYQRGGRLSLYPVESSITDTVVVETLRNPIGSTYPGSLDSCKIRLTDL
ncbi:uncharacterized protein ARMOST_14383 [Armillaria ostoyae]|uniref:Uncharacterized protein n=1 Tax=Armillaria ostoyae TaxID=47428 RepID=A0A284RQE0_ARMOS|nr:uncharacterized protein ARMOST_14383 [Armillaria ostoyae]